MSFPGVCKTGGNQGGCKPVFKIQNGKNRKMVPLAGPFVCIFWMLWGHRQTILVLFFCLDMNENSLLSLFSLNPLFFAFFFRSNFIVVVV